MVTDADDEDDADEEIFDGGGGKTSTHMIGWWGGREVFPCINTNTSRNEQISSNMYVGQVDSPRV